MCIVYTGGSQWNYVGVMYVDLVYRVSYNIIDPAALFDSWQKYIWRLSLVCVSA